MPPTAPDTRRIVDRVHPEFARNEVRYRWLQDSYDGDHYYRDGVYGTDASGYPLHNLVRHKHEYPIDQAGKRLPYDARGQDAAAMAGLDDFEYRRARTPIPNFVSEATDVHLAKIFAEEIERDGPDVLKAWWDDVDGNGTSIDQWMQFEVAPYLRVFGLIDVCFDRPPVPPGEKVVTRADEIRLKLNTCVASCILPQNMQWWQLGPKGEYLECLVREPQDSGETWYRHWTADDWTLYDEDGKEVERRPHAFKRVPIIRLFDARDPRGKNLGKSWSEPLAILQREYYNRDSELVLSDTLQAHPFLEGPEDWVTPDNTVPMGPGFVLPKKKNNTGGQADYEGWGFVQPSKDGSESLRLNKQDIRDAADRYACLTKPAGAQGSTGQTVAQSGLSKRLDASTANNLLSKLASVLARAEMSVAEMALHVLGGAKGKARPAGPDPSIKIVYPRRFDLFSAEEIADAFGRIQGLLAGCGQCPETEKQFARNYIKESLPGLGDKQYEKLFDEIDEFIESKAAGREKQPKAGIDPDAGQPPIPPAEPTDPPASPAAGAKPEARAEPGPPEAS